MLKILNNVRDVLALSHDQQNREEHLQTLCKDIGQILKRKRIIVK